jgi:predicted nucleic acid-binding protein
MTIVADASALYVALVDVTNRGGWLRSMLSAHDVAAPELALAETANALRRRAAQGRISDDIATLAYHDLLSLTMDLHPFEPYAERIWQLRGSLTPYDAWYVAMAEELGAELVTLDMRVANAGGQNFARRCQR